MKHTLYCEVRGYRQNETKATSPKNLHFKFQNKISKGGLSTPFYMWVCLGVFARYHLESPNGHFWRRTGMLMENMPLLVNATSQIQKLHIFGKVTL